MKVKTLILVHKTFLQNQWYDRIKKFTNARIGIIRQDKIDVENKDFIIGMIQSISMKDYDMEIFKDIGLLICDEVHHCGSPVFSQALMKIRPKYTLGLSATINRKDGLTKVIKWFLGDIIYKLERNNNIINDDKKQMFNVNVKIFEYISTNKTLFTEKKRWFSNKTRPDKIKMISNLINIEERNQFILNIIKNLLKTDERKTLIISDRIKHVNYLKEITDKYIQEEINKGNIQENEIKTSLYIGKMKEYELNDAIEADFIFATSQMALEGLDIQGLNCLMLTTPLKDVVQASGRIQREEIKDRIICPLIIDISDQLSIFSNWGQGRKKYYENTKNNFAVDVYHVKNNDCISIKDYLVVNKLMSKTEKDINEIRKQYIIFKYGSDIYDMELELEFVSFPLKMFEENINIENAMIIKEDNYNE